MDHTGDEFVARYVDERGSETIGRGRRKKAAMHDLARKLLEMPLYRDPPPPPGAHLSSVEDIYVRDVGNRARRVVDTAAMEAMMCELNRADWVAVDVEGTDRKPPETIQVHIASRRGEGAEYVVFPHMTDRGIGPDSWSRLRAFFVTTAIPIVFFAASNDLLSLCLERREMQNFVDIQERAEAMGLNAQTSLTGMLGRVLGESIAPKSPRRSFPSIRSIADMHAAERFITYGAADAYVTALIYRAVM